MDLTQIFHDFTVGFKSNLPIYIGLIVIGGGMAISTIKDGEKPPKTIQELIHRVTDKNASICEFTTDLNIKKICGWKP